MNHEDRRANAEFFQRLLDHPALDGGRRILLSRAQTPAMAWAIDQKHPMLAGEHVSERLLHGLEIRAGAMDQHDWRTGRVAGPDIDDVERGAGHLDPHALRGIAALQDDDTSLCNQRQNHQHRHENQ